MPSRVFRFWEANQIIPAIIGFIPVSIDHAALTAAGEFVEVLLRLFLYAVERRIH